MKNLTIITAYLDAICDEDDITTTREFVLYYKDQLGYFPTIAEVEYFEYYANMFHVLSIVEIE